MLSRNNLTLSALSNRLNLGTRALALNASVNNGDTTLRIRQFHHDVMRQSMVWHVVQPVRLQTYDISPMPDSIIPGSQQRPIRCGSQVPSRGARRLSVEPKPSLVWTLKKSKPGPERLVPMSAEAAMAASSPRFSASKRAAGLAVAARPAAATA